MAPIRLGFNRSLGKAPVAGAATLWDGAREIRVDVHRAAMGRVLVVEPTDPLDFGTVYRVEISPSLAPSGLNGGGASNPLEFRTEGNPPPLPSGDSLRANLLALAHDSMRGRGSGSADEMKAALYLRNRFLSYGLQEAPGGAIQGFQAYAPRLGAYLTSRNVLAVLPGTGDLSEEWVVVGAHFDHIGFLGLDGEELGPNNGADDNGSGTATILEMARLLKSYADAGGFGSAHRRSVLFAAFGAEEVGLLGSCSYVNDSPAVPLAYTAAMLNFDMVGRLRDNTLHLSGIGTSTAWPHLVQNANEPGLGLSITASSCPGCTDHACFWRAGIPFVGFFTGLHPEYHLPDDDVDLINFPGLVRVGGLAFRILSRLMVKPDPPILTGVYPGTA